MARNFHETLAAIDEFYMGKSPVLDILPVLKDGDSSASHDAEKHAGSSGANVG